MLLKHNFKNYLVEMLGTFFLVFVGTGAIIVNNETHALGHVGVAMSWGLIVMVLVYGLGDLSGAHLNPAVSIAFVIAKRFKFNQLLPYILSQILGAILASVTLKELFPLDEFLGGTQPLGTWQQSFVLEFILTFLLMYIILNVSTGAKEKGIMAGAAIGATVGLEAMFAGPICGASMNPARSIAPALISGHLENLWIYILATIFGAVIAVFADKITRKEL